MYRYARQKNSSGEACSTARAGTSPALATPPNVPEGRAEALREAFMATMKDPRAGIEIDRPVDGPTVEAVSQDHVRIVPNGD